MSKCLKICQGIDNLKFKAHFLSKISVCRQELGGSNPQPPAIPTLVGGEPCATLAASLDGGHTRVTGALLCVAHSSEQTDTRITHVHHWGNTLVLHTIHTSAQCNAQLLSTGTKTGA